jgi:hypothetical protein
MFARFEQFLVSNGSIAPMQIPYYVKWVTECYAACKSPVDKILAADQKKQYLEHLENTREEWQVKQAEQALRLYTFFVSRYGQRAVATSDEGKLWEQIVEKMIKVMRLKHLSLNTEKTYTGWNRQFQAFVNGKAPNDLSTDDIRNFLSYLAVERKIAASTQNQALNAVLFLFRHGLEKHVADLDAVRARKKRRLPVVFSPEEVSQVFGLLYFGGRFLTSFTNLSDNIYCHLLTCQPTAFPSTRVTTYFVISHHITADSISMTQVWFERDEPLKIGKVQRTVPLPADHSSTDPRHKNKHYHRWVAPYRQRPLPEDRLHGEDVPLRAVSHAGKTSGALRRRYRRAGMHRKP